LAFHGGDHNEGFDLLVDGRRLQTIRLQGNANDTFVERTIALPADLVQAAVRRGITIKLVAFPGRRTSGLFDLRLLRSE
ncbi:DUF6805 domain-containing protein, partial [Ramlibacter sp.]|uniref:DUF6805 domain-containing protein n=1 Tax=Ramlibacter sp. TaxID=1917967 RepID=UPI002FCC892C